MLTILWVFPSNFLARKFFNWQLARLTNRPELTPSIARDLADTLNRAAKLQSTTKAELTLAPKTSQQVNDAVTLAMLNGTARGPYIDLAEAVGNYSRSASGDWSASPEAQRAALAADELVRKAVGPIVAGSNNIVDSADARSAISALTRAINLSGGEFKASLLMQRASLHAFLGMPDDALRDAQEAQQLGLVDPGDLAWTEALALAMRGRREDLRRALNWINLAIKLPPSTQGLPPDSGPSVHAEQLRLRGSIYAKLGDQIGALNAFHENLSFVTDNYLPYLSRRQAYLDVITTSLRLGQREEALIIAAGWQRESGDPLAVSVHFVLEMDEASQALAQILEIENQKK